MPKYRFTTGRYSSSGEKIKTRIEAPTKGRLSTLSGLRTGKTTRASPAKPYAPPKTTKPKKSSAVAGYKVGSDGRYRNVLENKGSARFYAQMKLGKQVKGGKFGDVPEYGVYADAFKTSVLAMANEFRAPSYMIRKIERMDPNALYLLSQNEELTIEVYFDYGADKMEDVDDIDLFYNTKWDDIQFLIDQYERAFGLIG